MKTVLLISVLFALWGCGQEIKKTEQKGESTVQEPVPADPSQQPTEVGVEQARKDQNDVPEMILARVEVKDGVEQSYAQTVSLNGQQGPKSGEEAEALFNAQQSNKIDYQVADFGNNDGEQSSTEQHYGYHGHPNYNYWGYNRYYYNSPYNSPYWRNRSYWYSHSPWYAGKLLGRGAWWGRNPYRYHYYNNYPRGPVGGVNQSYTSYYYVNYQAQAYNDCRPQPSGSYYRYYTYRSGYSY